eukprot:757736-Hanusia_phi.AAC.6
MSPTVIRARLIRAVTSLVRTELAAAGRPPVLPGSTLAAAAARVRSRAGCPAGRPRSDKCRSAGPATVNENDHRRMPTLKA